LEEEWLLDLIGVEEESRIDYNVET